MTQSAQLPTFRTQLIPVNNLTLSVKIAGSGQPIVLFHSLLADETSFNRITPELAKNFQVIQLSLPGFGDSSFIDGLDASADFIAAAIRVLKLNKAPIFLGNGYGGFVALNTAIRHSDLPSKLVLADCGACFTEQGRAAFKGMSTNAAANGMTAIADVAMRRLFAPAYQTEHPELIAERKERFLAMNPQTFHAACAALGSMDLRPNLPELKIPSLVLVGELDEATPPPMSTELAKGLPNSSLHVLAGLAHVPQLQDPDTFLATIRTFISE